MYRLALNPGGNGRKMLYDPFLEILYSPVEETKPPYLPCSRGCFHVHSRRMGGVDGKCQGWEAGGALSGGDAVLLGWDPDRKGRGKHLREVAVRWGQWRGGDEDRGARRWRRHRGGDGPSHGGKELGLWAPGSGEPAWTCGSEPEAGGLQEEAGMAMGFVRSSNPDPVPGRCVL